MYVTVRAGMHSEQHRVRQQSLPEGPAKSARPETAQCEEGNVCLPDLHPLFFFCGWHLRERSLRTLCFFFPWLYSPSRPLRCISVGAASEQRSSGVSGAWLSHRLHDNRRHGLLVSSQLEEGGSQPPLALPRYSAAWILLPTIS